MVATSALVDAGSLQNISQGSSSSSSGCGCSFATSCSCSAPASAESSTTAGSSGAPKKATCSLSRQFLPPTPRVGDTKERASSSTPGASAPPPPSLVVDDVNQLLRQEIECLENVVDQLESERDALKKRLADTFFQEQKQLFDPEKCQKWLQNNFEFDRQDTPLWICHIFEKYLLESSNVDGHGGRGAPATTSWVGDEPNAMELLGADGPPSNGASDAEEPKDPQKGAIKKKRKKHKTEFLLLPHQLLIKNSFRALRQSHEQQQTRQQRKKLLQASSNGTLSPVRKKRKQQQEDPDYIGTPALSPTSTASSANDAQGQVSLPEMHALYASKPWLALLPNWPQVPVQGNNRQSQELHDIQQSFLKKHAFALWERHHWFPIKPESAPTEEERRLLRTAHSQRKRRQIKLKTGLEEASITLPKRFPSTGLLNKSIFSVRGVAKILKRPRIWLPTGDKPLVEQLRQLDRDEPERCAVS